MQCRRHQLQCRAIPRQHCDAILCPRGARLLHLVLLGADELDNLLHLRGACGVALHYCGVVCSAQTPRHKTQVQVEGLFRFRRFARGFRMRVLNAASIGHGKDAFEGAIHLPHQSGHSTEISAQRHQIKHQRIARCNFHACVAHLCEQFGLGVAEEVDGLHGVADHKAGVPLTPAPCAHQPLQQFVLLAARVLKLIHQQMTNAIGSGNGSVARLTIRRGQHGGGSLRHLHKIHRAGFGKQNAQLSRRAAQHDEARAHDAPIVFRIARRRQHRNRSQRLAQTINFIQRRGERAKALLGWLARIACGEAMILVEPARRAPFTVIRQQKLRQGCIRVAHQLQ